MPDETKKNKPTAETPVPDPDAAFARFEQLTRKILRVPKDAIRETKDRPQPQS